jgi:hypothetical protein
MGKINQVQELGDGKITKIAPKSHSLPQCPDTVEK